MEQDLTDEELEELLELEDLFAVFMLAEEEEVFMLAEEEEGTINIELGQEFIDAVCELVGEGFEASPRGPDIPKNGTKYAELMAMSSDAFQKHMQVNKERFDYEVSRLRPVMDRLPGPGKPRRSTELKCCAAFW